MKFYLSNIVLVTLSLSQLATSTTIPEANIEYSPVKVETKGINNYGSYSGYSGYGDYPGSYKQSDFFEKYYKSLWNKLYQNSLKLPTDNKLNPSDYIGKKIVRKSQQPPYGGNYVLESTFPEPYRIIKPGDMVTMDYRPGRLNVKVDSNDFITELTYG